VAFPRDQTTLRQKPLADRARLIAALQMGFEIGERIPPVSVTAKVLQDAREVITADIQT
jgi:hypothetical protein